MRQWLIYKHTSIKSGKSYVGQACRSLETRWKEHVKAASKGSEFHFHRAIRLYGDENWTHEVLATKLDTIEEACTIEKYFIKKYDTFENGYNSTWGGEGVQLDSTEYEFYNPELDINRIGTPTELAEEFQLHQGYVRYVAQGKSKHCNGWFLWQGSEQEYVKDPLYTFEHENYGIETLTLKDMAKKYNLSKGNLHSVATGKRRHTKGWTTPGEVTVNTRKLPANNARSVVVSSSNSTAEYSSILVAAQTLGVSESVVRDRCTGRCSTNKYKDMTITFKEGLCQS